MGVLKEVWTGRVLEYLTLSDQDSFLQGITDYSANVETLSTSANVIHLISMGVLPEVLINNTTYPIAYQNISEDDVVIQLNKYQTLATPVTDDELFALSYDKQKTVVERHGLAIQIEKTKMSIHALAPSGNTAAMPVLLTTGPDDGTGRKRCTWEDIANLKTAIDNLEIPEVGRRLCLCSDHMNDLTLIDQRFKDQYYNRLTGKVYNQLGFDFYDYVSNPYYTPATKTKLSYGAIPAPTDRRASVFYSLARSARATGLMKMYYKLAELEPTLQQSVVNFRHYHIVLPLEEAARGAIVSDNVV